MRHRDRAFACIFVLIVGATTCAAAQHDAAERDAARGEAALAKLSRGHPEVAQLLQTYPDIRSYIVDPTWSEVVLHAPLLPGTPWQVHDLRRPQPTVVKVDPAACQSSQPPADAVVIFAGHDLEGFTGAGRTQWSIEHGELVAGGRDNNHLLTRRAFGNVQIHLEFAEPQPAQAAWQYRGNSGLFLMDRYEIQILDSYQNPTYPDGQSGALYGQVPPLVNASLPPGVWQCYDVVFRAPRFEGTTLKSPARVTLFYNGVLVQADSPFRGPTAFATLTRYEPHASQLPFSLQDHGEASSRVRFRNIWARPLQHTPPR